MTQLIKSAFPVNGDAALVFAQQALDRANELARSQIEFAESACREVFGSCAELMALRDPSAVAQAWPKVWQSVVAKSTEGSVAALKGNVEFGREMFQVAQRHLPEVSKQLVERALEPIVAASNAANELAQQRVNGDKPASQRAKKAA